MDEITDVVKAIVTGCLANKVVCSPLLAAFVARTVLESDSQTFALDKELTDADVNAVINKSVLRLLERDSPKMECVKMQVAFDASHVAGEDALYSQREQAQARRTELQRPIVSSRGVDAGDFDALTALYREIFALLTKDKEGAEYDDSVRRQVEREVAAAVESVFPRIGLKSFVMLSTEDKKLQLEELSHIILGIRLFFIIPRTQSLSLCFGIRFPVG